MCMSIEYFFHKIVEDRIETYRYKTKQKTAVQQKLGLHLIMRQTIGLTGYIRPPN